MPDKPLHKQESLWFSILAGIGAAIAAAPEIIEQLTPLIPDRYQKLAFAASIICGAFAARRARVPGAEARERVGAVEQAVTGETDPQAATAAVKAQVSG